MSSTYLDDVIDELISLDIPLEEARQLCCIHESVLLSAQVAGFQPYGVAETLVDLRSRDIQDTVIQRHATTQNAANQQARDVYATTHHANGQPEGGYVFPYRLLSGHVSPKTAFVIEDYPSGFKLRCRIRYWLETAVKGAQKNRMRMAYETTHKNFNHAYTDLLNTAVDAGERMPKQHGNVPAAALELLCSRWNAPKYSTYSDFLCMYKNALDPNDFAVYQSCLNGTDGPAPFVQFTKLWQVGVVVGGVPVCPFTSVELDKIRQVMIKSREYNPNSWGEAYNDHPEYRSLFQ